MKKIRNIVLGGIQQKIFNLVLISILLIMAAYTAVIMYQSNSLTALVRDANQSQKESITATSEATMEAIMDSNLAQSTAMEAYIAEDVLGDVARIVRVIADYTSKLFASPDDFPSRVVSLPDKDKDGEISVQVLTKENVDLSDPVVKSKLGLIGNLSELMMALYGDANVNVDSCYCALPEGVMLLVDDHSSTKFDKETDELIPIDFTDRAWYVGAAESGKLFYTDVTTEHYSGEISIMCSFPVYVNDELVAVIGADLFLNDVSAAVNGTARYGSFICIINQKGHVLFSPQTEGVFSVAPEQEAQDLRESDNAALSEFIKKALSTGTELSMIDIDGIPYYLIGSPIKNVGWTVVSVVPRSLADQPATAMLAQFDSIQNDATESFRRGIKQAEITILVLIAVVLIISISAAILMSKKIVKPLTSITNRVRSLGGNDLQFFMEDEYRTHDEIEVLAESFAMLSGKTLEYISEVQRVTAEKERIGAELSLATRIQADMLPNIFPAFPERTEFDVYASMDPAKEVGGDFYDFFLVDDDHLCMFIADVSGKGVPAALFMMASMIMLANNAKMGKTPAEILRDTNSSICANNREEMFVTVWLGILEISTGKLTAANAGHEYPVVKLPNGKFELLKDKHGFVIGGMDGAKYVNYEIQMQPGSKLFVYTDGVPEATNAEKELFGVQRMLDALNACDGSPKEILEDVRKSVDEFVKDAEQFDDLTMMCMEYKG